MFLSNKFPIENRLGLETQDVQRVMKDFAKLRAPEVTSDPNFARKEPGLFRQIVEYLSDWHLVSFLSTTGLISEVLISNLGVVLTMIDILIPERYEVTYPSRLCGRLRGLTTIPRTLQDEWVGNAHDVHSGECSYVL